MSSFPTNKFSDTDIEMDQVETMVSIDIDSGWDRRINLNKLNTDGLAPTDTNPWIMHRTNIDRPTSDLYNPPILDHTSGAGGPTLNLPHSQPSRGRDDSAWSNIDMLGRQGPIHLFHAHRSGTEDSSGQEGESNVPAQPSGDGSRRRTREPSETPESDNMLGGKQENNLERVTKVQLVERDTIQVIEQLNFQAAQIQHLVNQVSDE